MRDAISSLLRAAMQDLEDEEHETTVSQVLRQAVKKDTSYTILYEDVPGTTR
jgi:hypothetical protein